MKNKIVEFFVLPSQKEVGTRVLVKPILRSHLNAFCAKLGVCVKGGANFPYSRITVGHWAWPLAWGVCTKKNLKLVRCVKHLNLYLGFYACLAENRLPTHLPDQTKNSKKNDFPSLLCELWRRFLIIAACKMFCLVCVCVFLSNYLLFLVYVSQILNQCVSQLWARAECAPIGNKRAFFG